MEGSETSKVKFLFLCVTRFFKFVPLNKIYSIKIKKIIWLGKYLLCVYFFDSIAERRISQLFWLMSAFGKCQRDCWCEKQNDFVVSALFCQGDFFCHFKSSKLSKKKKKKNWTKIPTPKQICACYVFQGILEIFSSIYALLFIFSKL